MANIQPVLDSIKELEGLIEEDLVADGKEITPQNRLDMLTSMFDEMRAEFPDSLSTRSMFVMFDWYCENLTREIAGLEPIPFQ